MCAKNELSARFIAAYEALLDNGKVTDKRDFALKIGISPSMVTEISKGRSNVGTLAIQNIVSLFDINAEWLLIGKGDMLKVSSTPSTPSSPSIHQDTPQQKSVGLKIQKVEPSSGRGIPLIPLDAIAGFPVDPNESVYLENCERYVVPEFENKGANFLIRVSGDSMIPLYYSGDLLACRKITDIRFFQWGTIYVIETSQGILVKRVQESENHEDCILCVSENSSVHKPFLLPRDDIRSLSVIVGLIRTI